MCYTYSELVTHFKCKYFDCLFVSFALTYPSLLYTIFMLVFSITYALAMQFLTCSTSCWVMTTCCMDQLNNKTKIR